MSACCVSEITFDDSLKLVDQKVYLHAAHCFIYCKEVDCGVTCYYGLMQMRADGYIGFPGGECDDEIESSEEIICGLNRELEEEISYNGPRIEALDHISTHIWDNPLKDKIYVLHFFAKEVTLLEFQEVERNNTRAKHFPQECLGVFRVPVVGSNGNRSAKYHHFRSFLSNFLQNRFIGNAKQQLLLTICKLSLLPEDEIVKIKETSL